MLFGLISSLATPLLVMESSLSDTSCRDCVLLRFQLNWDSCEFNIFFACLGKQDMKGIKSSEHLEEISFSGI